MTTKLCRSGPRVDLFCCQHLAICWQTWSICWPVCAKFWLTSCHFGPNSLRISFNFGRFGPSSGQFWPSLFLHTKFVIVMLVLFLTQLRCFSDRTDDKTAFVSGRGRGVFLRLTLGVIDRIDDQLSWQSRRPTTTEGSGKIRFATMRRGKSGAVWI